MKDYDYDNEFSKKEKIKRTIAYIGSSIIMITGIPVLLMIIYNTIFVSPLDIPEKMGVIPHTLFLMFGLGILLVVIGTSNFSKRN